MTFQTIIEEIENNLKLILDDLSMTTTSFTVEVAKPGFGDLQNLDSAMLVLTLHFYLQKK